MKYFPFKKFIIIITLLLGSFLWILMTESGLRAAFWLARPFFFSGVSIQSLHGKLISQIELQGINMLANNIRLNIQQVTFTPQIFSLLKMQKQNFPFRFQNTVIESQDETFSPIVIPNSSGSFSLDRKTDELVFEVQEIEGANNKVPLKGYGGVKFSQNQLSFLDTSIVFGDSHFTIKESDTQKTMWDFSIQKDDLLLSASGVLIPEETTNHWQGVIEKLKLNSAVVGQWHLPKPTAFTLSDQAVDIPKILLANERKESAISAFSWSKTSGITATFDVEHFRLRHQRCTATASLQLNITQEPNKIPAILGTLTFQPGNICLLTVNKNEKILEYLGGQLQLRSTQQDGLSLKVDLRDSRKNQLEAIVESNAFEDMATFLTQPIHGEMKGSWSDLELLYLFVPEISHLLAQLEIQASVAGTIKNPEFSVKGTLDQVSFYLPIQGIQFKDTQLMFEGESTKSFSITGSGILGKNPFQIEGSILPSENFKTQVHFSGQDLQIYNTSQLQLWASPNLQINYTDQTLFIDGQVEIPRGSIHLKSNDHAVSRSKDIVLTDEPTSSKSKFLPNLSLILGKEVHFQGYGLECQIYGELQITPRTDGLLSGAGKLKIRKGKYRLQGSNKYIHRGYLLFPEGTLLANPLLDIRLSKNRLPNQDQSSDVGIYIQGTLQNPVMQLYSNSDLNNKEILSKLGFSGGPGNGQNSQIAQGAALLGNINPLAQSLEQNFGLEELNVESKDSNNLQSEGGTDTVLVIGKSLTPKIYLQFLQGVMEATSAIRLQYFLSPRFTTSIETGTDGLGGDIIFSTEKD